ncbi:putative glycoprotein [Pteromalus puparum negative-strand RNA virus 1]|uniref:Putative glycoprotein n=1 Tax=Pteromalus puparum negative-strand RNA virus 1 TaxID=1926633 RepID=A0A1L5BWQ0_9MONO|nr:putative glycoprotein [Pteromalus puparum negative-strand RNA virus 1]APL97666.1 putative glycoprotein [Pteromalus puparum negative-strand RNA virus 1]
MYLFTVTLLLPAAAALVGYDCNKKGMGHPYAIGSMSECRKFDKGAISSSAWAGTILQVPKQTQTPHKTCKLLLRSYSMYCTYYNNPTMLEKYSDDVDLTPYIMDEQDCIDAWDKRVFYYQGTQISVNPGGVTKILIGADIDENGFCRTSKGTSTVVKGHIELVWAEVMEVTDLRGQPKRRELDGEGLRWSLTRKSSTTVTGVTVLTNSPPTAMCSWQSIYQGAGELLEYPGSETYVTIPKLSSGFKLITVVTVCGLRVSVTDDPSIFLVNTTAVDVTPANDEFSGRYSSYFKSGLLGLQLILQSGMTTTTRDLLKNQCILEQMIQQNVVHQASKHPGLAAYTLTGVRGWTIILSGAGVILKQCTEVAVVLRPQDECYTDIPITINSTSSPLFLDPTTHIIKISSHTIECDDDSNPIFQVRNQYYRMTPKLVPVRGLPNLPSVLSDLNTTLLSPGTGLYPNEVLNHLDEGMSHISRKEEVERQLLKLGSNDFKTIHDGTGVIGSLVNYVVESGPTRWLMIASITIGSLSITISILLGVVIYRSRLWLVLAKKSTIAEYQATLLGQELDRRNQQQV